MKLDPKKTAMWVCGLAVLASVLLLQWEGQPDEPSPAPVVEQPAQPLEPPVVAPRDLTPIPAPAVDVTVPVTPAPKAVAKPAPKLSAPKVAPKAAPTPVAAMKPKPKFKKKVLATKDRRNTSRCSLVPAEAYAHSTALVMATAAGRGLTPEALSTLRWCIGG